jgi:hypothetical protein
MKPNALHGTFRRLWVLGIAFAILASLLFAMGTVPVRNSYAKPDPMIQRDDRPADAMIATATEAPLGSPSSNWVRSEKTGSEPLVAVAPERIDRLRSKIELVNDLNEQHEQQPRHSARSILLSRLLVQSDPAVERAFLVVAPDPVAAKAFNGYFSFYFDWSDSRQQYPVLILDRLFPEDQREQATETRQFSHPEIEQELLQWLGKLVDPDQPNDLLEFILENYRLDFAGRLNAASADPGTIGLVPWQRSRKFDSLEVTYFADRESYCTFLSA